MLVMSLHYFAVARLDGEIDGWTLGLQPTHTHTHNLSPLCAIVFAARKLLLFTLSVIAFHCSLRAARLFLSALPFSAASLGRIEMQKVDYAEENFF